MGALANSSRAPIYSSSTPNRRSSSPTSIRAPRNAAATEVITGAEQHRLPDDALVLDMRDEGAGGAADKIQQIHPAGGILVYPGHRGEVEDQQGAAADAETADNPGD